MAVRTEPGTPLTDRELEIARLVTEGLTNGQIAGRLFISKRTVDSHVLHIYSKTQTGNRTRLTLWLMGAAD